MGKVPRAKNIPLGEIPNRYDERDKNQHYNPFRWQKQQCMAFLMQMDYNLTNMIGGMMTWE
ncbi:MAG: hypothetical protein IMW92_01950 [Bacillales bacterium]|nr:hypothetical protein [Bacillales bacterium]